MKILLTGGVGFIGKYVAHLLKSEHEVVAFDNLLPQVHADPVASVQAFPGDVIQGDVAERDDWAKLCRFDAVIHLAAETGTAQSMYETERYRRVNVGGTRLAGEFAARWEAPLVSMSSRAVYGEGRYECTEHGVTFGSTCCGDACPGASKESDPFRPLSVYGETKAEGEQILTEEFAAKIPISIVRPQNVVGPGQDLHNPYTGVLAAFLARLKEGRSITVYGSGEQTRDFIHVQDVARLLAWLIQGDANAGVPTIVNSGTGVRTTLNELAQYAALGSPQGTTDIDHLDIHRAGDIEHAVADLTHGRELGIPMPEISTERAVREFIEKSWDKPGAPSVQWDDALKELADNGLASGAGESCQ